jgi:hypothetical protein
MRYLVILAIFSLFLTACATNYHYQSENNPNQYLGKNIAVVQKQWGSADQVFHTRSGASYYLYSTTSGNNFFTATSTNFSLLQNDAEFPSTGRFGLQCSAIFKTDKNDIIVSTSHAGSNCGGEWAPNS